MDEASEDVMTEVARLRAALKDAIEGMEDMLPHVEPYFQWKWGNQGYIDRAKAALEARP